MNNDTTEPTTKTPRRKQKPADAKPFRAYATIKGQVVLEEVHAPDAQTALALAKEQRTALARELDANPVKDCALHVSELSVIRYGKKVEKACDPEKAPDPSPAQALYNTLMGNRSCAVRQSDRRSRAVRNAVVSLAIEAGLRFDKNDIGGRDGIPTGWGHYQLAIESGNTSFCQALEHHDARPPFFFDGRIFQGQILEWPRCVWGEKLAPWPDDAPASWDGSRVAVTSFGHSEELGHYVIACSRRREGKVVQPHHGWEKTVRADLKIKRKFKITVEDMRRFEKARAEGVQIEGWIAEMMPCLNQDKARIRRDVLRAAPKDVLADLKAWTDAFRRGEPPACLAALESESERVETFEPAVEALRKLGVNGFTAVDLAGWTTEQLEAVQAWAASDTYQAPAAVLDVVSEDHVRARAVLTAEGGTIQALLGSTKEARSASTLDVLPRLAAELEPTELGLLFGYGRADLKNNPDQLARVLSTDDGLRVRKLVVEIVNAHGWAKAHAEERAAARADGAQDDGFAESAEDES